MVEIFDDIRKLYRFKDPCDELRHYIEFFSETSLEATSRYVATETFTVKLFPSYTPTIWINLGAPYYLASGNKSYFIDSQTDILLLRNQIVERRNFRTDNIFTVKFHPGGFEAVFGIGQQKIESAIIDVKTIIPISLLHKLKQLDCFEDRMSIIQNHFLRLLNRRFFDTHLYKTVNDAIHAYSLSGMAFNNNQLAGEVAITDKTLYRYFKSVIGAPPKTYFAIVRARTALTAYILNRKMFLPADYGYYDESHFYKDVLKFTGQSLMKSRS